MYCEDVINCYLTKWKSVLWLDEKDSLLPCRLKVMKEEFETSLLLGLSSITLQRFA